MDIVIGDRVVGEGHPTFIIAEAGSNHDGKIEQARRLVDVAAEAGVDAVKFQFFRAEHLYSRFTPEFEYLKGQNVYELIESIETPRDWIAELAGHCRERDVIFLASPFDREAVDLLDGFVPAFKVASFEIEDLELIRHIASKGKPVIISTGMASMGEIEEAVEAVRSEGNDEIVLLHCNSTYPTPADGVNLRAIETMKRIFQVPVGFSDHTEGIHIPLSAIAMGARVIEKHFTLDRGLPGPDHSFAIEPDQLRELVSLAREIESALGDGVKRRSTYEDGEMYTKARRSIHARVDIPEGTTLTREMLITKRPGYGIKPKFVGTIVGKVAKRDIKADEWIMWDMI